MGAFVDPRVEQYARLLVDRSLGVQAGWQVMLVATPSARPLVEELVRQIGRKGAWPLVRLSYVDQEQVPFDSLWASEAPEDLLGTMAPGEARVREELDAWLLIFGSENTRGGTILAPERRAEAAPGVHGLHAAAADRRAPVGGLPLPDRGARPGGGDDARRLRRLRLRRLPPGLGGGSARG